MVLPGGEGYVCVSCHNRDTGVQGGWGTCTKSGSVSGRAEAAAWPGEQERSSSSSVTVTCHPQCTLLPRLSFQGSSTLEGVILLPVGKAWQYPKADWHDVSSSLWYSWCVGSLPWGPRYPGKDQWAAKACAWLCLSGLCPWAIPHPFLGVQGQGR